MESANFFLFDSLRKEDDKSTIEALIKAGADLNAETSYLSKTCSPLHIAVTKRSTATVQLLIDSGANINCFDQYCSQVLHYASRYGCKEMVRFLLEKGVDINAKNLKGYTPLYVAIENSRNDIAILLIDFGANINSSKYEWSPLMRASRHGRMEIVHYLLQKGASLDEKDSSGDTALHIAILNRHQEVSELLINCGADVNSCSFLNMTQLHYASKYRCAKVIGSLVKKGVDLNAKNIDGATPLYLAMKNKAIDTTELLLRLGADCNIEFDNHVTIFSCLIEEWPNEQVIRLYIEHGAYLKPGDYSRIIKNSSQRKCIERCKNVLTSRYK